jgi:hypothetical protein
VDPQQVCVFPAGVAPCVPALLSVKLVHVESLVCGARRGKAVMVKLFAVGVTVML